VKTFHGIEELREAVGTHLGHSAWFELDQDRVNAFADATGDHQWIHVDVERAAEGPFGSTIAHGFLTLSLIPSLTWEIFEIKGLTMEVNYGLNSLRFPTPALIPGRVRAGVELLSVEPSGQAHMATMKIVVEAEGADKPLCVAESLAYLVPA
jgi:acyl dehydratase